MPLAKRLSSKFYVCPRNFGSRANVYLSAADIILRHTSHRKRFIYPLPATSAASIHWWGFACSRQKKPCFATYQYLHVCRSLVLRLRAMDFIVSCSKWICLLFSRRLFYSIMSCEMNVQWKLFLKEYESTLIFDRGEGLNNTLWQY